jgi:hypothetical protein
MEDRKACARRGSSDVQLTCPAFTFIAVFALPYFSGVLFYASGSTTATRVYGQLGSFTTNEPNKGGLTANSLYWPCSMALDASGFYVSDYSNNRSEHEAQGV